MFNIIFCLLIYVLFAFVVLFGVHTKKSEGITDDLSRLNLLRGLFALEVVVGHCVRYETTLLSPFGNFMLVSVGFFFFISGFGLAHSYNTKDSYLTTFISKRFVKLLYIALNALIFTTVIAYISPVKTDFADIPTSISTFFKALFLRTNWYIRELLLLYIIFYITFKLFHTRQCHIIAAFCIIISIILFYLGYTRCWYASILCFPFGVYVGQYHDDFTQFLSKSASKLMAVILVCIGLASSVFNSYLSSHSVMNFALTEFIFSIGNNILCIGFIILLVIVIKQCIFDNAVLRFFSRYSTELFVFQFIFVEIAEKMQLPYYTKIAFILSLDLIVSVVLHKLFNIYPAKKTG